MQPKTESMFTTDDFAPSPVEAYLEKALKNCTNGLRSPGDEPACKKQKLDVYSEPAVCDKQEARENSKPAVSEKQETKENSDPAVYEKQKTAEKVEPTVCEKQTAEENRPPPRTPPREVSSSPFCDTPPPGENDVPPPIEKNIVPTCEPPSSAANGEKSYVDSNDEDADDPGVPDESSIAGESLKNNNLFLVLIFYLFSLVQLKMIRILLAKPAKVSLEIMVEGLKKIFCMRFQLILAVLKCFDLFCGIFALSRLRSSPRV